MEKLDRNILFEPENIERFILIPVNSFRSLKIFMKLKIVNAERVLTKLQDLNIACFKTYSFVV